MSLSAIVRALVSTGATPEMILAVVEAHEAEHGPIGGCIRVTIPTALRAYIIERDGFTCSYCGSNSGPFEVDHIRPVVSGGTNDPENLTCACVTCNRSKGGKTLEQWRRA